MDELPEVPENLRRGREDGQFEPAPLFADWIRGTFIAEEAPLGHAEHSHLQPARLGILLTNEERTRKGRRVLGEAELPGPHGVYGWHRGRLDQQRRRWFSDWFDGAPVDFIITLFAPYIFRRLAEEDPMAICALVEHELCHCGQKKRDGIPQFTELGRPKWTIKGHDAEVFSHVLRRYGAHTSGIEDVERALRKGPTVDSATVRGVCGCGAEVA